MVAYLVISLSALVACLVLLDLFLTDRQKRLLGDGLIRLWSFLDDLKTRSINEIFAIGPARAALGALVFGCIYSINSIVYTSNPANSIVNHPLVEIPLISLSAGIFLWVIPTCLAPAMKRWPKSTLAATYLVLIFMVCLAIFMFANERAVGGRISWSILMKITAVVGVCLFLVIAILFGMIYSAAAILRAFEFIVLRIVEYPKGPILAFSILVGCIAAILKILS